MNNTISVIVPIYNVEKYLSQCIDSILRQTYKELEVILVDDGSTDMSGHICDGYAVRDRRIKIIHKQNGGAASAKNEGLRIAKGEFLTFVDGDDYLEEDAYEYMLEQLKKYQADMIQCAFRNVYANGQEDYITINQFKNFGTQEYLKRFTVDWTCGLLWDKLYRRSLFDEVFFEEGHKIDDEFFTYQGILKANKILHSSKIVYNYRKRKSGVMLNSESQKRILFDKLDYLEKRRIKVSAKFPALKQDFDYHFLSMLLILSKDNAATEESIHIIQKLLKKYFKEEEHCKMGLYLRIQLFKLRYKNPKHILSKKDMLHEENLTYQYFE